MAKVVLGQRPKNFKREVSFPMLDGVEGVITCVFKYRTKTEFGAFIDQLFTDAGVAPGSDISIAGLMARTVEKNGRYLIDILEGWDVDKDLTLTTAQQLADELPGGAAAIMEAYRQAVVEGRLGN